MEIKRSRMATAKETTKLARMCTQITAVGEDDIPVVDVIVVADAAVGLARARDVRMEMADRWILWT